MPKLHSVYICQQCGYKSPTYLGRCPQCDCWNSMVETVEESLESRVKSQGRKSRLPTLATSHSSIIELSRIEKADYKRIDTGFEEFNRVLGGGIVLGSIVLVAGDPGIGKSTLLTQLALNINYSVIARSETTKQSSSDKPQIKIATLPSVTRNDNGGVLYVAGEESAQQIKIRVDRIKPNASLAVLNETDVDNIVDTITQTKPSLVIVDSVQTMETADLNSMAGSIAQVRECSYRLQKAAKDLHIPIFLVGHVTKEGNLAGPKTLEHAVDVVLSLEGDPASMFRVLRSSKNRFGPTDEVGIFEMAENGMGEVKNPSKVFLEQRVKAPGSAVVVTMTGYRPLLVEIQALVTKSFLPVPRRVGLGIDNNRLQLLSAVLAKRLSLPLFDKDIFVNVTGGLNINEPAVDLGVAAAIISSLKDIAISAKAAFIGEVGLLGEIRTVGQMEKRIREAKKLGFAYIISPINTHSLQDMVKQLFNHKPEALSGHH